MKEFSDTLLKAVKMTCGRVDQQQVFRDLVAYCALQLSNRTDPVHLKVRQEQQAAIVKNYTDQEKNQFMDISKQLAGEVVRNINQGSYVDLLGPAHQVLHPKSGPLKQDFTPPSIGRILSRITLEGARLPEAGFFTCNEPACGSGVLCLGLAEELLRQGFNPCEQLVIQASDLDRLCVQMTYLQLSLYGIPAVIIQGDTITLEEYDRWYTPLYIWRKWVWRAPMPFSSGHNRSDELLKMASEPWYALARNMEALINQKVDNACG